MAHSTWTHPKILLFCSAVALLTNLVVVGIEGGATVSQYLFWSFSTFILIYVPLLGTAGKPCRLWVGRNPGSSVDKAT
jgi:hypothetical protein